MSSAGVCRGRTCSASPVLTAGRHLKTKHEAAPVLKEFALRGSPGALQVGQLGQGLPNRPKRK